MGSSAYTRARLAEAAGASRTLSEALVRLGVDPRSSTRQYVRSRMKKLGVDVSHFEREGVRWTREILQSAVSASTNMGEVLRHLGLEVVGGHHTYISRRVKAYDIDTSHFRLPSRRGLARRPRTAEGLLVEQAAGHARRIPSDRLRWALTTSGVPELCAFCGMEAVWLGHPLPLEIDHINGNWRDNRIGNLRFLCPNCHSTTASYRGRGQGRGRDDIT
ncbi:HNH endonuclease [Streptomyces sp. NPDC005732]|uniref:HNH endonuclease signature motif containing protein n=1 Tax=Streptomyces sp. NPDC005732 TaxID=3157057 RepID=UPI0034058EE7